MQNSRNLRSVLFAAASALLVVMTVSAPVEAQAPYHRTQARPPHRVVSKPRHRRR